MNVLFPFIIAAVTIIAEISFAEPLPVLEPVDGCLGGAAAMAGKQNCACSPYFPSHDFFSESPTQTLVRLERFRTCQQTSERSCGAACARMTLEWFGCHGETEAALDRELDIRYTGNRRTDGGYGCTVKALTTLFRKRGFQVQSSVEQPPFESAEVFSCWILEALRARAAVLVENVTWGGHWCVVIGYDTMGTESIGDDVLVLADPYDTADHCQDGYTVKPFEPFFYEWFDAGVLTPGITRQPFVRVAKRSAKSSISDLPSTPNKDL